jgi:hypothetical protein
MPKQDCKYGKKCYQKNDEHKTKYNHPESDDDEDADHLNVPKETRKRSRSPNEQNASKKDKNSSSEEAESSKSPPFEVPKGVKTDFPIPDDCGYEPGHMFDIYDPQIKYSQKKEHQVCKTKKCNYSLITVFLIR